MKGDVYGFYRSASVLAFILFQATMLLGQGLSSTIEDMLVIYRNSLLLILGWQLASLPGPGADGEVAPLEEE